MKTYVKDTHANKQINTIASLVESGSSDLDIVKKLTELEYKNLSSMDGVWNQESVKKIRETFKLNSTDGFSPSNKIIVKIYNGNQQQAMIAFQADATKMAANGYFPTAQSWVPGTYGCGAFLLALLLCLILVGILVFIYMIIVKPDGVLSVTYELRSASETIAREVSANEKTCPKCAEQIKEAAIVCRYCGHNFA
jgi:uncharacterized membrane protein